MTSGRGKASSPGGKSEGSFGWVGYAMTAASVWLGWQMIQPPVIDRAPPSLALRLAPASPEALRRAAESEQSAGRWENAINLANDSLTRAPFNARALRARGLSEARAGREQSADEMLTLAGNWSLRDDPAHAWLVDYRLRRGDYSSAFAHADTLARRRVDTYPRIFNLFTTAAAQDQRAISPLANILAAKPAWRIEYLSSLYERQEGPTVLMALALAMERTDGPFETWELRRLYGTWASDRRFEAIRYLRSHIKRPSLAETVQNADFDLEPDNQLLPFGWTIGTAPGLNVEFTTDDIRGSERAMRVEYDGYGTEVITQQMTMLPAGTYVLRVDERVELKPRDNRLAWAVTCAENGASLLSQPAATSATDNKWRTVSARFTVPATDCTTQWLRIEPRPGDRQSAAIAWFDKVSVARVTAPESSNR